MLAFKAAYAKRTSTSADEIDIYFSLDCGKSWDFRKSFTATKLSNDVIETGNFIPNASQWIQQTCDITGAYAFCKNLLYKIRFVSNNGNNVYLDDIMITGSLGIDEEWLSKMNLNIYPNPLKDNSVVAFDMTGKQHVTITTSDVLGRVMSTVFDGSLNPGHYEYPVAENLRLAAGVYFVNFSIGDHSVTKKLIVSE